MKIYVASSWRNDHQPGVVRALRDEGHEVYDFRNPHQTGPDRRRAGRGFHWSEIDPQWKSWSPSEFRAALSHELAADGFHSDKDGLDWCDACVLVLPCGRSAHLEAGYAVGKGKLTLVLLSDGEPELMYRFFDGIAVTLEELLVALSQR